jgi:hypothetical protein
MRLSARNRDVIGLLALVARGLARRVVLFQGTDVVIAEGDLERGRGVGEVMLFRRADDGGRHDRVALSVNA